MSLLELERCAGQFEGHLEQPPGEGHQLGPRQAAVAVPCCLGQHIGVPARTAPMPGTYRSRSGLASTMSNAASPKTRTSLIAQAGPMPRITPEARCFWTPHGAVPSATRRRFSFQHPKDSRPASHGFGVRLAPCNRPHAARRILCRSIAPCQFSRARASPRRARLDGRPTVPRRFCPVQVSPERWRLDHRGRHPQRG